MHGQVLHRAHTAEAPAEHKTAGGKAWDTVKPLGRHFRNLARVVLIDDDAFKVRPAACWSIVTSPMRAQCWVREMGLSGL